MFVPSALNCLPGMLGASLLSELNLMLMNGQRRFEGARSKAERISRVTRSFPQGSARSSYISNLSGISAKKKSVPPPSASTYKTACGFSARGCTGFATPRPWTLSLHGRASS